MGEIPPALIEASEQQIAEIRRETALLLACCEALRGEVDYRSEWGEHAFYKAWLASRTNSSDGAGP